MPTSIKQFIEFLKRQQAQIISEHTTATNKEEAMRLLTLAIGTMPTDELERRKFVRRKMIEAFEGKIDGAVFEVSTPS